MMKQEMKEHPYNVYRMDSPWKLHKTHFFSKDLTVVIRLDLKYHHSCIICLKFKDAFIYN